MDEQSKANIVLSYQGVELYWLKHAGLKIKTKEGVIYIDPYQIKADHEKADILFISHSHYDHLDEPSIKAVIKSETTLFCPDECKTKLAEITQLEHIVALFPNDEYIHGHLKVQSTPAYNLTKPYHPKEKQWLGFVIYVDGVKIYFTGDTDHLKELENINCDIGLFPIGGIYGMDAVEAAGLANVIKPKIMSIPVHWGTLVDDQGRMLGTEADAKKFCELCHGPSQIMKPIG